MTVYERCATHFYDLLLRTWASEEALAQVFELCHRGPTFDRTVHGKLVVLRLFNESWRHAHDGNAPVDVLADRVETLRALLPLVKGNFNLFTQVSMNLLDFYLEINQDALAKTYNAVALEFANRNDVPNPFSGQKSKVKVSSATHPAETVKRYAYATSLIKAKNLLTTFNQGAVSFRITPNGRTPAITDSEGFCNLPAAGDVYYHPHPHWGLGLQMGFLSWGPGYEATPSDVLPDGTIVFPALPEDWRSYKSESGGNMLQQVMTSRATAFQVWEAWARTQDRSIAIIPRVNSVQIFGTKEFLEQISRSFVGMMWTWGARPEILKD